MILALLVEDSLGDVAQRVKLTLGARFTIGLILHPLNGTHSGLLLFSFRNETRLFVGKML